MKDLSRQVPECSNCDSHKTEKCALTKLMESEEVEALFFRENVRCSKYKGKRRVTWWVVELVEKHMPFLSRDKAREFIKQEGKENVEKFFKMEGMVE